MRIMTVICSGVGARDTCVFKKVLLVAGGYNHGFLSSIEIFFPSNGRWVTTTTNLPRFSNHLN